MNPECIVTTDFINGFKVVSTYPALSDAEYEEKEQKIVEDILKSLSTNECTRTVHKAKASLTGGNDAEVE
ncbi:MAG: hypothetical protein GX936_07610 [Clostridiales bacterium]|nr:hypothetical protein [Clostridiales bacterium]